MCSLYQSRSTNGSTHHRACFTCHHCSASPFSWRSPHIAANGRFFYACIWLAHRLHVTRMRLLRTVESVHLSLFFCKTEKKRMQSVLTCIKSQAIRLPECGRCLNIHIYRAALTYMRKFLKGRLIRGCAYLIYTDYRKFASFSGRCNGQQRPPKSVHTASHDLRNLTIWHILACVALGA